VLFPTPEYALFFLCVFAAAWAVHRRAQLHKLLLLGASYAFYAFWDWRFLPLLMGISLLAALVGRRLQEKRSPRARRALLAGGVTAALSTLGFFKYLGFASVAVVGLLRALGITVTPARLPEMALPVGISFFVFHAISLMVDAYRDRIPVRVKVIDALLYVAFFPQLVAGPILRAASFLPQLARPPDPAAVDAARALELIVVGLVKKVLIASFLATHLVEPVFAAPAEHPGLEALLGIYAYAGQIYCDFSGYTDIALGSALLLGYRFPDNFDAPYSARSPQEFWYRWHISLSSWLRDYLYMPLCGEVGRPARRAAALALTMVLGGLWHGAAWTFVAWGAFHGAGLVAHWSWSRSRARWIRKVRAAWIWPHLGRLFTFHFVCLGWVLFRSSSLEASWDLVASLAHGWTMGPWLTVAAVLALTAGLLGPLFPSAPRVWLRAHFARLPMVAQGFSFALAVLLIEVAGPQGVAPFIYFQF
jgi:D-alanyl-lipoteichoic acid acyltransferase DltB (MBOAT superfamily)